MRRYLCKWEGAKCKIGENKNVDLKWSEGPKIKVERHKHEDLDQRAEEPECRHKRAAGCKQARKRHMRTRDVRVQAGQA